MAKKLHIENRERKMAKKLHIKNRERKITIQLGVTINTGNFSNIKMDIGEEFWINETQDLETEYTAHLDRLKQIIRNEEFKRREALKPKPKPPAENSDDEKPF